MHMISDANRLPGAPNLAASHDRGQIRRGGLNIAGSREGGFRKRRAGAEDVEIGRTLRALPVRARIGRTQANYLS
jgi:hypothetical protein